jgi:hypothetical protein
MDFNCDAFPTLGLDGTADTSANEATLEPEKVPSPELIIPVKPKAPKIVKANPLVKTQKIKPDLDDMPALPSDEPTAQPIEPVDFQQ